jgi:Cu(I)/Ag(I) efflux system membrane fusion protein
MHPEIVAEEFGRCPICGMDLEKHTVIDHSTQAHRNDSAETMYVCPMHPEVMKSEPGRCPVCEMFLEEQEQGGHDQ